MHQAIKNFMTFKIRMQFWNWIFIFIIIVYESRRLIDNLYNRTGRYRYKCALDTPLVLSMCRFIRFSFPLIRNSNSLFGSLSTYDSRFFCACLSERVKIWMLAIYKLKLSLFSRPILMRYQLELLFDLAFHTIGYE